MTFSAAQAGFAYQTIWKHRLKDDAFREKMDLAVDQGEARAKARLMEDKVKGDVGIDGEIEPADIEPADPQIVLNIIGARERARQGHPRLQRTTARIATNKEVEKALRKRLAAFARRERAMKGGTDGPPRDGEGNHPEDGGGGPHAALSPLHPAAARRGYAQVQAAPGSPQPVRGTGGLSIPRAGEEL